MSVNESQKLWTDKAKGGVNLKYHSDLTRIIRRLTA